MIKLKTVELKRKLALKLLHWANRLAPDLRRNIFNRVKEIELIAKEKPLTEDEGIRAIGAIASNCKNLMVVVHTQYAMNIINSKIRHVLSMNNPN